MFGLGRPSCPVDDETREWIDASWARLESFFGADVPRNAPLVLPTRAFFPDAFGGSEPAFEAFFDPIVSFMGLDGEDIRVEFYESEDGPMRHDPHFAPRESSGAAGLYTEAYGGKSANLYFSDDLLHDPIALAGTIAHELGHVHLIGGGHLESDEWDHEPLTDLLTVYFGLGIFTANSAVQQKGWLEAGYEGWSVQRLGYLPQEALAYALARFARTKADPPIKAWLRHMNTDISSYFRKSLKYLRRVGRS